MSDEELSVSEKLRRAAQQATEASQKEADPVEDPLTIENVSEKIRENVTGDTLIGNFGRSMYTRYKVVRSTAKRIRRTRDTLGVIWNSKIVRGLTLGGSWVATKYWHGCKWAFKKASYNEETDTYNKKRGAVVGVVLAAGTVLLGQQVVTNGIPLVFKFGYDAVAINLFTKRDTLVFSQPSPVEGEPNVFSVYACRKYPCEGQTDSIEFRMRDSIYLDVVRGVTKFEPHDPGELAGAFVSEENACNVEYYGQRWKYFGFYPYINKATCRPISGTTSPEDALNYMRALRPDLKPKQP